jgi:hypothetical protein
MLVAGAVQAAAVVVVVLLEVALSAVAGLMTVRGWTKRAASRWCRGTT